MGKDKSKLVSEIIKITKREPEAFFDRLIDKSQEYLEKLLKVAKHLK
jgi:hypothetical protein